MARAFDGSSSIQGSIGGLVGVNSGAHTIAVIGKRGTSGTDMVLVSMETSGNSSKLAMEWGNTGNNLNLVIGSSSKDTNIDVATTDNWVCAVVNRAAGTSTPRGHKYVYSTDTWSHADASATSGGDSTDLTGGRIQLAQWQNTARFTGDMLIAAVWKRSLADAEIESLAFSLQAWIATSPDALWPLWQGATTTNVPDLSGLGANQTGITGTSVSSNSAPVFSLGHTITVPSFVAGGGTDATATPATVSVSAAVPAPTVSTGSTVTATAVTAAAVVPSVTVATGSTVTAASVTAAAAVPGPTVATGSTVTATSVAAPVVVAGPTVATGSTVTPTSVSAAAVIPTPAVSAGGNANATPASVVAVLTIQSVTVSVGSTVTLTTVAALASVPVPVISAAVPGTLTSTSSAGGFASATSAQGRLTNSSAGGDA